MKSNLFSIGNGTIVGENVMIDDYVIIGTNGHIGNNCKIHYFSHIDNDVIIGDNVKIQDHVMIPHGVTLEDGVFVGPNVTFSNDKYPRSLNPDGTLKSASDWVCVNTLIKKGAALGAGCVIVCGVTVGEWSMVGAGAVVTKDVPDYAMVVGNPARIVKWVSRKGYPMSFVKYEDQVVVLFCDKEKTEYRIPIESYQLMALP